MVAARGDRVWQTFENRTAIVTDETRLAVEDARRVADLGAKCSADSLMTETHAERRDRWSEFPHDIRANAEVPRVRGVAGTRR